MPAATPQSIQFANEFNKRLGDYIGSRAQVTPDEALTVDLSARLANAARRRKMKEEADKAKKKTTTKKEGAPAQKSALGNLSQEAVDVITENGDTSNWAKMGLLEGAVAALGVKNVSMAALGQPVKWGLEGLARISHAGFGGLTELTAAQNEGQTFWRSIGDAADTAWEGLKGNQDMGGGEVFEALAQVPEGERPLGQELKELPTETNPIKSLGKALGIASRVSPFSTVWSNKAAQTGEWDYFPDPLVPSPKVQHVLKTGAGFFGELYLDATNATGVKVVSKLAKADELVNFSADGYRQVSKEIIDDAAKAQGLDAGLGARAGVVTTTDPVTGVKTYTQKYVKDELYDNVDETIDNTILEVGGGATSGRVIGQNLSPYQIATRSANKLREIHTRGLEKFHQLFQKDVLLGGKQLTSADIARARKDPFVAAYLDQLLINMNASRNVNKFADIEEALLYYSKNTSADLVRHSDNAAAHAASLLDTRLQKYADDVFKNLQGKIYNAPGLRVGNAVVPFNRIGRAYAVRKAKGLGMSDLKYGDQFIGRTPRISTKVRNLGHLAYEELFHEVKTASANLTKADKVAIQHAILAKAESSLPPELQTAAAFIKTKYKEIYQQLKDAGLDVGPEVDNFIFNYYKRGSKYGKIKDYKDNVVKFRLARSGPVPSLDAAHITDAIKAGLKPEEDAFRALLYYKLTANRKLTRTWFRDNLLDNYGILGKRLSPQFINNARLKRITALNAQTKAAMQPGEEWFLPSDIHAVLKRYEDMTGGAGSTDLNAFIRLTDTVTRWFKTAATLPWPGFHVRNSIGDLFMSFLDGVRSSDYTFLRKWAFDFRRNPNSTRRIGNKDWTLTELRQIFKENAASAGHQIVDTTDASVISKVNPTRAGAKARELSERREDIFRFTHFLHAFKEEFPKALKNTTNETRALNNAIDAATYRVNKYLFDYGALTSNESKYLKRIFPFYTYTRKAIPTLAESFFLHPSQFSKTQRWFLSDAEDNSYNDMLTPEYQREIGYARLSSEDDSTNPWLLGGQFLPTDVLKRNMDLSSHSGFLRNLMSQTNPFVKAASEIPGGEKFFNQQEIGGPGGYYASSFLPFVDPLEDLMGGGVPTPVGPDVPGLNEVPGFGGGNKSGWMERLGSGRIGAGLPFDKVVEGQQTAAAMALQEKIKDELGKYNVGLEKNGYKLYFSPRKDGTTFRIRRLSTDQVIYETTDAEKAAKRAQALGG